MTNDKKTYEKIYGLLQELYGSYYLIPNIDKYLIKVLNIINSEFSLIASSVHFNTSSNKSITIMHESDKKKFFSDKQISKLLQKIIDEQDIILNKKTISLTLNQFTEAHVIPIFFESKIIAIIVLIHKRNALAIESTILDYIRIYISAALVANYFITQEKKSQDSTFEFPYDADISIKKILNWRLQEIMEKFFCSTFQAKSLFKEISIETEKILVKAALTKANSNKTKAAKLLGLNRNTFRKKLKDFNIN